MLSKAKSHHKSHITTQMIQNGVGSKIKPRGKGHALNLWNYKLLSGFVGKLFCPINGGERPLE